MDTQCRQVLLNDYVDEEIDQYCAREDVQEFFYRDQLEDIRSNLAAQRPSFSVQDLESAIDHYWTCDAFLSLE